MTVLHTIYCVLFFSRPHPRVGHTIGRTFSIYLCPLSFWLTLPQGVLSTSWCCPSRPCMVFLACVHLTLFLALSLSPGNSFVSSWCDHSIAVMTINTLSTNHNGYSSPWYSSMEKSGFWRQGLKQRNNKGNTVFFWRYTIARNLLLRHNTRRGLAIKEQSKKQLEV